MTCWHNPRLIIFITNNLYNNLICVTNKHWNNWLKISLSTILASKSHSKTYLPCVKISLSKIFYLRQNLTLKTTLLPFRSQSENYLHCVKISLLKIPYFRLNLQFRTLDLASASPNWSTSLASEPPNASVSQVKQQIKDVSESGSQWSKF